MGPDRTLASALSSPTATGDPAVDPVPLPARAHDRLAERLSVQLGLLLLTALLGCELGTRLDDWVFSGVPLLANPSYESLFQTDAAGNKVGRPGARWKRVRMNNLGMRGRDVSATPRSGCTRLLFLGASETFGEPTAANQEFPDLLRGLLPADACFEVLNSAIPGLSPHHFASRYRESLAKYGADIVLVYPSTHLYLGEMPGPKRTRSDRGETIDVSTGPFDPALRSRFYDRLSGAGLTPVFLQRHRVRSWIAEATAGKPGDWYFHDAPRERIDRLKSDLRELVSTVVGSGATPMLITHAIRSESPPRPEDLDDLIAMRVYVPRASEAAIARFELEAARAVRDVGAETRTQVIDVARALNGRRDRFVDLVHFSPKGSSEVADLIAAAVRAEPARER